MSMTSIFRRINMENKAKNTQKNPNKGKILNSIVIVFLSIVLVVSVGGFYVLGKILQDSPTLAVGNFEGKENTVIYDAEGNEIITLSMYGEDGVRENVTYDKIPQVIIDAFLSVEDSRYFKHNGFDLPRLIKSALENISNFDLGQGGSTLTMQMVDVTTMSKIAKPDDPALVRIKQKIQEIFLSLNAERQLDKKIILEKYLNKINFGGPARGVQKGAEYYFGKSVEDITLSEAAFLAGVINAPAFFNAYYEYDQAIERRNVTLDLMLYHGYISEEEHDLAVNTELAFQLEGPTLFETSPYLSFIDKVTEEVKELSGGLDPYIVPMEIYTTMNRGAQELADQILNGEAGINYPQDDELFQVGFSLMDNQNGEIQALGGGRGYDGDLRNSRAYIQQKQAGSSIKPILDYALTFDYLGWATDHVMLDAPMKYRGTNIPLSNADGLNRGDVTYQYAVAISLNTTAINALQEVIDTIGLDRVIQHMQKLEFKAFEGMSSDQFSTGYGIGGADMQTTPLEMAGAFSIFANNGNYITPHTVRKVVFKDKSQEDIAPNYETVNIISPQAAYLMSVLLEDAVSTNWQNLLQIMISPYPVYGKTGTSDWADDGLSYGIPQLAMKDKWMVNYTSKYTVATWAGYDEPVAGKFTWFDTNKMLLNVPGQINKKLFDFIHTDNYPSAIAQPSGVVSISHVKGAFDNGYFSAPEGTPDEMISTGLIKSEFATLKPLAAETLEPLKTFDAKYDSQHGMMQFNFTPYPNLDKLKEGSTTYDGIEGYPDFKSTKIYDPAFIFGPVVYRVDITSNNITLGTFDYNIEKAEEKLSLDPGQSVEVCGYYSYKLNPLTSNKVCSTIKNNDTERPSGPGDIDGPGGPGDIEGPDEELPERPDGPGGDPIPEPVDPTDEEVRP